jgi:hypothetical protein
MTVCFLSILKHTRLYGSLSPNTSKAKAVWQSFAKHFQSEGCLNIFVFFSVMDMLKFHKFTIGHAWTTDFGCADKPDEFKYLIK